MKSYRELGGCCSGDDVAISTDMAVTRRNFCHVAGAINVVAAVFETRVAAVTVSFVLYRAVSVVAAFPRKDFTVVVTFA